MLPVWSGEGFVFHRFVEKHPFFKASTGKERTLTICAVSTIPHCTIAALLGEAVLASERGAIVHTF